MSKSFEDVIDIYTNPDPKWTVFVNGKEFSKNLEFFEFEFSMNSPTKVSVKTGGVGLTEDVAQGNKIVIKKGGAEVFTGVVQQDGSGTGKEGMIKAADYASELQTQKQKKYDSSDNATATEIVNFLVDGTEFDVGGVTKTFSTSFDLNTTVNVEDFRINRTQIEDLNRLMGEYGLEWYITIDGSGNPVLNVTDGLIVTDSGSPLGTFKTSGRDQNAKKIDQNTNRNKGDYEAVVVRGYGDGDNQIVAKAEKKDIQSADKQNDTFTVNGDITSALSNGDALIVESKGGLLGGGGGGGNAGEYTVSSTSYDSNNDETTITVNEDVTDDSGGLLSGGSGTLVYNVDNIGELRTKIYTDKTVLSANEAESRARRYLSNRSSVWREIEVKPSTTDNIYGVGEVYKVEEDDAKLNDKFRVVESYYKIRLDQNVSESKLTLSNKPQSFYDDFRNEEDTTRSQTDHAQGAPNTQSFKEAENAKNGVPSTNQFQLKPSHIEDEAGQTRVPEFYLDYDVDPYRKEYGGASYNGSDPQVQNNSDNTQPDVENSSGNTEPDVQNQSGDRQPDVENSSGNKEPGVKDSSGTETTINDDFLDNTTSWNNVSSSGWTDVATVGGTTSGYIFHYIEIDMGDIDGSYNLDIALEEGDGGGNGPSIFHQQFDDVGGQASAENSGSDTYWAEAIVVPAQALYGFQDPKEYTLRMSSKGSGSPSVDGALTLRGISHTHSDGSYSATDHDHDDGSYDASDHDHPDGFYTAQDHDHDDGSYDASDHDHTDGSYDVNAADIDNITIGDDVTDAQNTNSSSVTIKLDKYDDQNDVWNNKFSTTQNNLLERDFDISDGGTYPDEPGYWRVRLEPDASQPDLVKSIVKMKHPVSSKNV